MNRFISTVGAAVAMALTATNLQAQEKLKIGLITTLSGPPAALGQQQRNGLQLAIKALGGKFGGREVELIIQDDELKPDVAVSKVKTLVEQLGDISIAISSTPTAATQQPIRRIPVRQPMPVQPTPAATSLGSAKPSISNARSAPAVAACTRRLLPSSKTTTRS